MPRRTVRTTMLLNGKDCAAFLMQHDGYLILTHKKPDGDTVGSAAALCAGLRAVGKRAYVLENPDITPRYAPYIAPFVSAADFVPETIVSVDVADTTLLPKNAVQYAETITLGIDHHDVSRLFTTHAYVESDSAATGEMIFLILEELGVALTKDMASALYAAVSTDTGCFRFANTTPRTHRIAARLMECGADWYEMNQTLFSVKTATRIAVESAILGSLTFYADGRIAVAVVSKAMKAKTGATQDDLDGISSLAYQIEGVEAGVTVFEQSDGYKISLRTGAGVDAAAVCARFGGGGHNRAAGCHFTCSLADAIASIVGAVEEELK